MKFAEMVKQARQKAGLSQGGLAQQMRTAKRPEGVWSTYVGQIEKGEKVPSEEICVKLAAVLALDRDELLLAAYESRADSEEVKDFFQKMKRALTDPVISRLLTDATPLDPALLDILADPALRAILAQGEWRQVLIRIAKSRKKRDIPGLLFRLEAMNDKQWNGLLGLLDGMGL